MKLLLFLMFVAVGQCGLLGTKKCTYGPSYWCSHIEHATECDALQHCMTTVWKNQELGLNEKCSDVIKILDDVRRAAVPDMLEKMAASCKEMPVEKHAMCKKLLTKNKDEVLLLLQSDLPSGSVATALGLCERLSAPAPQPLVKQNVPDNRDVCTDCKNFFGDLQQLANDSITKMAEELKEKVCTKTGFFEQLCNETVDTYAEFVDTVLVQQLNPADLCFLFRLCDSESHADLTKTIEYIAAKAKLHKLECEVCESIFKDIQTALGNPTLQNEILAAVENDICALLPGNISAECKSYVAEYGKVLFELLVAELDPATVCTSLGMCNGTAQEPKLTVVPLHKSMSTVHVMAPQPQKKTQISPECVLCEYIMDELKKMLGENATEEEIEAALDKVCSVLPSTLSEECNSFMKEYGDKIAKLLLEGVSEAVCTLLGLCFGDQHVPAKPLAVNGEKECLVCEYLVGYLRRFLNDPDNVKIIYDVMYKVCIVVPDSYRPMCKNAIDTYAPAFLNLLNKYDDPLKLCTELKLCTGTQTKGMKRVQPAKPLTFTPMVELQPAKAISVCTQGPQVFCATVERAKICKAVEFCVQHHNLKVNNA